MRIRRLAAFVLGFILLQAVLHAQLQVVASNSYTMEGRDRPFGKLSSPVRLADGSVAFVATPSFEETESTLVIEREGRFRVYTRADFGAAKSNSISPFGLQLIAGGSRLLVLAFNHDPTGGLKLFSIDTDGVPQVVADVSSHRIGPFTPRFITRGDDIAMGWWGTDHRPLSDFLTYRIGFVRNGEFEEAEKGNGPADLLGIVPSTPGTPAALYFHAQRIGIRVIQGGVGRTVLSNEETFEGKPITIGSPKVAPDGTIVFFDNWSDQILMVRNGTLSVLVGKDSLPMTSSQILAIDTKHVYFTDSFTGMRGATVYRVDRTTRAVESFFDPRATFSGVIKVTDFSVDPVGGELVLKIAESGGNQQAIFRGADFKPTNFPAVPPGYPVLHLDNLSELGFRAGSTRILEAKVIEGDATHFAWTHNAKPVQAGSLHYSDPNNPSLELRPFLQTYHAGTYVVSATNSAGTSYASTGAFSLSDGDYSYDAGQGRPGLMNFSARAFAGSGENTMIAGAILKVPVNGVIDPLIEYNQEVLIRSVGPGLSPFLGDFAPTTRLDLVSEHQLLATNDGAWSSDPRIPALAGRLGAFPLPSGSRDSALVRTMAPGAYTALVTGGSSGGTALLEYYVAGGRGRFRNFSTRSRVGNGPSETAILGFILVPGVQWNPARPMLIRAVGRGLERFGVKTAARNPILRLYRSGILIAENRDFRKAPNREAIVTSGQIYDAFELKDTEGDAALFLFLQPGVYTATVSTEAGDEGVALLELYTSIGAD